MKSRAFTLIELLVVISIIGVLSSIVLASLNSARVKGQEAAIKSNLKSMIAQAELSYDSVSPNSYINACTNTSAMRTAITNTGGTATCYSYDNTRWGASAKLNSDSSKNWAVDSSGVVTWDTADISGSTLTWYAAVSACAAVGKRLPSLEQLKALSLMYGSGNPPSFQYNYYWTNTELVSNSANVYFVDSSYGTVSNSPKAVTHLVRCVH